MDNRRQEEYIENVRALVKPYLGELSPESADEITSLIEHGEPAEGVCSFAWAMANKNAKISADVAIKIREYTDGLVPREFLPSNLDALIQ